MITAQSGADSGSWQITLPTLGPDTWQLTSPVDIYSSTNPSLVLGEIDGLSVFLDSDPTVSLNFAVIAGATTTTFTISSPVVSFGALSNPQAFATAAVTLTDNDGNGATFSGLYPGTESYQALYNGASSLFASLVPTFSVGPNDSNISSQRFPVTGTVTIPGSVTDIQSQFNFTLTANDEASGTSRFNVVPEPSSLLLAALGGLGLMWRLRRRLV